MIIPVHCITTIIFLIQVISGYGDNTSEANVRTISSNAKDSASQYSSTTLHPEPSMNSAQNSEFQRQMNLEYAQSLPTVPNVQYQSFGVPNFPWQYGFPGSQYMRTVPFPAFTTQSLTPLVQNSIPTQIYQYPSNHNQPRGKQTVEDNGKAVLQPQHGEHSKPNLLEETTLSKTEMNLNSESYPVEHAGNKRSLPYYSQNQYPYQAPYAGSYQSPVPNSYQSPPAPAFQMPPSPSYQPNQFQAPASPSQYQTSVGTEQLQTSHDQLQSAPLQQYQSPANQYQCDQSPNNQATHPEQLQSVPNSSPYHCAGSQEQYQSQSNSDPPANSNQAETPSLVSSSGEGADINSLPPQVKEFMDMIPQILNSQESSCQQPHMPSRYARYTHMSPFSYGPHLRNSLLHKRMRYFPRNNPYHY